MTVADILQTEPASISVFQKYGIDCSGCSDHQFDQACRKYSVDPQVVKEDLLHLRRSLNLAHESFGQLLEGVLHQHTVIKDAIPHVRHVLLLAIEHESTHVDELLTIKRKREVLIENLEVHLYKEEMILFPEFINLWNQKSHRTGYALSFPMMHPIKGLETEHESVKSILIEIRELIRYYKIPRYSGRHYRAVCLELESFEKSMMKLIDLEDQILFPEALALEKIFTHD